MFTSSMYSYSNGGSGIGHEHPTNCNPITTTNKNNITPKALQAFASNSLIRETETNHKTRIISFRVKPEGKFLGGIGGRGLHQHVGYIQPNGRRPCTQSQHSKL